MGKIRRNVAENATPDPVNRAAVLGDSSHCVFRAFRNAPEDASLQLYNVVEDGEEAVTLMSLGEIAMLYDFLGECLARLQSGMN